MGLNKAIIAGIVAEKPRFLSDSLYKNALEIKLDINRRDSNDRIERLTCYVINDNLIDKGLNRIEVGDYLISQSARLITLPILREKNMICPHCGKQIHRKRKALHTDVVLYDFHLMKGISIEESVGINKVYFIGMVRGNIMCDQYNDRYAKFQLVTNRPKGVEERLLDSVPEGIKVESFDLPTFTCFGELKKQAIEHIERGQTLSVEGSIQERTARQNVKSCCPNCREMSEQSFEYPVHEVIAASIHPQTMTIIEVKEQLSSGLLINDSGEQSVQEEMNDEDLDVTIDCIKEAALKKEEKKVARKQRRKAETKEREKRQAQRFAEKMDE